MKSYEEYVNQKYNHLTILEIYRNSNKKPIAKCLCDCGNIKDINLYNVIGQKTKTCGCGERESRYNRKHANTEIIGKKFGRLTVIRDSGKRESNGSVAWECLCDCGNITYAGSSNLKCGHTTSCGCAINDYIDSMKVDIIGMKFGKLTVKEELDRSKYNRRTYLCTCDCGNEHIVDGASLTTMHSLSCGCSTRSNGELLVSEILKELNISYKQEFKFDDCRNKRRLPFDFYLPDYNICIEYQGKQHYEMVGWFGGENGFAQRQLTDNIKKQYCSDNNICLLAIPYYMKKEEIKTEILNALNP